MTKRTRIPSMTSGQIAKTFDGEDKAFRCEPFKLKRTKKVKAKLWAPHVVIGSQPVHTYTLPCTAEAYDAMVEQMAAAIGTHSYKRCKWSDIPDTSRPYYRNEARWALRAIGITRPEGGK